MILMGIGKWMSVKYKIRMCTYKVGDGELLSGVGRELSKEHMDDLFLWEL